MLDLESKFPGGLYSAAEVKFGKPAPDLFLHAAQREGVHNSDAVVIEDSAGGVQAAVSAGMRVIGLLAASHVRPGHGEKLRAAGAAFIANDYGEVSKILGTLSAI